MVQPSPVGSVQPVLRAHYLSTHKRSANVTIIEPTGQQAALVQFVQVQAALIEPQRQHINDQMQVMAQLQEQREQQATYWHALISFAKAEASLGYDNAQYRASARIYASLLS